MATRREEIMAAMKTNMAGITVAAGYALTVNKAERGLIHPDHVSGPDLPAVYIAGADEKRKSVGNPNFLSVMVISLVGYVENSNSLEALQQDLNKLIGAITKRIYADPKLSGLAVLSEVVSVETDDGMFYPKAVCEIGVEVQYVRPGNEP